MDDTTGMGQAMFESAVNAENRKQALQIKQLQKAVADLVTAYEAQLESIIVLGKRVSTLEEKRI